ncbi:MAG: hypothetical protein IJ141_10650 [Lachnospiraceae bacterium]|nr:hypothetical protein [Lachnospiraceae bacterium]
MSIAEQLNDFFYRSGQKVFIEVEGTLPTVKKFLKEYNLRFNHDIDEYNEGIRILQNDANKWGVELRLYFNDDSEVPQNIKVTHNRAYRSDYFYRINDVKLIKEMFGLGYVIGKNR